MDPTPLAETLAASRARFVTFVERRLGSRDAAEDVVQAAYERALEHAAELRDATRSDAWFYRSLRNAIVDRARRRGAEARALESLAREIDALSPEPETPTRPCPCVGELVPVLKPEYAVMLRRVDVDGASPQDVARELGITSNNASVRLHRARAALRALLEGRCGACAERGCVDCACSAA